MAAHPLSDLRAEPISKQLCSGTLGTHALLMRWSAHGKPTYTKPSEVVAEDGRVLVGGPDGVDVALSPDAALETGKRLIDAAAEVAGQERVTKLDHRPK